MHGTIKLFASLARFSPGGLAGTPFDMNLPEIRRLCRMS